MEDSVARGNNKEKKMLQNEGPCASTFNSVHELSLRQRILPVIYLSFSYLCSSSLLTLFFFTLR